jgi:hypothetical protein
VGYKPPLGFAGRKPSRWNSGGVVAGPGRRRLRSSAERGPHNPNPALSTIAATRLFWIRLRQSRFPPPSTSSEFHGPERRSHQGQPLTQNSSAPAGARWGEQLPEPAFGPTGAQSIGPPPVMRLVLRPQPGQDLQRRVGAELRAEVGVFDALDCLHRAGWSVGDVVAGGTWIVSGANGENRIHATGATPTEAWRRACEQAADAGMLAPPRPGDDDHDGARDQRRGDR